MRGALRVRRDGSGVAVTIGPRPLPTVETAASVSVVALLWVLVSCSGVELLLRASRLGADWRATAIACATVLLFVWSACGVVALISFLRWAFLVETIDVRRDRWVIRRSIAFFARSRVIEPRAIRGVTLTRQRLWIQLGSGALAIGSAASRAGRAKLRKLLSRALGRQELPHVDEADASIRPSANETPRGFVALFDLDGLTVELDPLGRLRRNLSLLAVTFAWNAALAGLILVAVIGHGAAPDPIADGQPLLDAANWSTWVFLSPSILVGLVLAGVLVVSCFSRTRYRLTPGRLEVLVSSPGTRIRRTFEDGRIVLHRASRFARGRAPRILHLLQVHDTRGRRETLFRDRSATRIRRLAAWMSHHTGFPVG